jgi:hypothetical protein
MTNKLLYFYMANQFIGAADTPLYKINIAGFSTDNFKTFNPKKYTILCRLGETCGGLHYFPKTSKIILDSNQQSRLLYANLETQFLPNVARDLGISEEATFKTSMDFFSDKSVVVQPTGLQDKFYNMMRYTQNSIPMIYTCEAILILKRTGMTGVQIITSAPLTFVGATYVGAIFFGYCGGIAENNSLGAVLNFTSFALSRPMRDVEITLNGLILRLISNIVGLPLILNVTQELLDGKGIAVQDYKNIGVAFERIINSKQFKKIKDIYNFLILTSKK